MPDELRGLNVAILAADGVERIEPEQPRGALHSAGATTELLSIHDGEIGARKKTSTMAATFPWRARLGRVGGRLRRAAVAGRHRQP